MGSLADGAQGNQRLQCDADNDRYGNVTFMMRKMGLPSRLASSVLILATGASAGWTPPSSSSTASPMPEAIARAPFPGATNVAGNVLNAVVDFLRPAVFDRQTTYIARRLNGASSFDDGDSGPPTAPADSGSRRQLLDGSPHETRPHLTCAAAAVNYTTEDSTVIIGQPVYHVSDWCFLTHLQPHVASIFAGLRSETLFIPTDQAFQRLLHDFPAFYEWLASLPSCAAGFNRMEYFLLGHATAVNASCYSLRCADCASSPPFRTLNAKAYEQLQLGLVGPPGEACRQGENATCLLDVAKRFDFGRRSTPAVLWEWRGNNGQISVVNRVLRPLGHPWATFPPGSLFDLITSHPEMTLFTQLLVNAGLLDDLLRANGTWHSKTVFAPLDCAFDKLSQPQRDYLLGSAGREVARYIALSHFLRGVTYVYCCALKEATQTLTNLTQVMESGAKVTFTINYQPQAAAAVTAVPSDTDWRLLLRFPSWTGTPFSATTAAGGCDYETTTGLLHKVDGLLIDDHAWSRMQQAVYGYY